MLPVFSKISNKTVRHNETFYKRYKSKNPDLPNLIKTNRGFFIDGVHVDKRSVDLWFAMNKDAKYAKWVIENPEEYFVNHLKKYE